MSSPEVGNGEAHPQGDGGVGGGSTTNFIKQIVEADLASGKHRSIITRFPPEPNGFLHLGHAKSICLNFGLAKQFGGKCNLRFDDTNPAKEKMVYIQSIIDDVHWLGGDFGEPLYASDYFQQFYEWALLLIKKGLAYIDEQSEADVRKNRGDLSTPGVNSPYRDRPIEENLELFEKMRAGEVPEGKMILRAKIDMTSGNMNMRDPIVYRVKHASHPRTGDKWCIYPMYDYAHGQEDSIEKITHSICTLEFEDHRPLYEWYQEKLEIFRTRQIEFARLNTTNTVMSKRKLLELVNHGVVDDWDDPRMPTICAMRRKGYPASALREFCDRVGVAKRNIVIGIEALEGCVREALHGVPRRLCVLRPLKVVLTNWPAGQVEDIEAANHPEDKNLGTRHIKFSGELWIDSSDFSENPPADFYRLSPGKEVRLRFGYWIKCTEVVKDPESGEVIELKCTYDPETKSGKAPSDGRKVKGTIHWVDFNDCTEIEVRLFDHLMYDQQAEGEDPADHQASAAELDDESSPISPSLPPTADGDQTERPIWMSRLNPNSLEVIPRCYAENTCASLKPGETVQFERVGFFTVDKRTDALVKYHEGPPFPTPERPVFNRTVGLVDSYAAIADEKSKEAQSKEASKVARAKAAAERQRKKEAKAAREAEKKEAKGAVVAAP